MQNIEPQVIGKKITIWFDYPFSWKFVEVCRNKGVRWDATKKKRYLKFSTATLPLSAERLIDNYKEVFAFYEQSVVEIFKKVMNALIKKQNKLPNILSQPLDLSKYPELFLHQKIGIQFLQDKKGLAILADEQGLGKTKTIAVWLLNERIPKTIIVTPLSARFIWRNELLTLGIPSEFINIVEKNLDGRFLIINYDKLKKFEKELLSLKIDCIVFDEAHLLKNRNSQRFKIAHKISRKIDKVICATGTPVSNRPIEIFPLLKLIKAPLSNSVTEFADRYCDRKLVSHGIGHHYDINGSSNLDELGEKLKYHMIRRLKRDCLDLPKKFYTIYSIDLTTKQINDYNNIEREYIKKLIKEKRDTFKIHLAYMGLLRMFCSKQKIPYTEEYIIDALESGEKILIYGYFNEPLLHLYNKYEKNSVIITGETKDRESARDAFQNDPRIKIFFGNIKAAGTALTLTQGRKVIFNDLSWNPTDHFQSEDRINRIGSEYEANIIYPIFKNTIEEDIYKLLKSKELLINTIMSGSEQHFKEESIVDELKKKYDTMANLINKPQKNV